MNYTVRKATLEDLPDLLICEQGVITSERPMDPTIKDGHIQYYNLPELIKNNNSIVLVAENNGKIIASGYANIKEDRHYLKHKKQGYLGFMFVFEEFRGKGVNKQIINELLAWCKSMQVFEIRLDVYEDNDPAISAYEKVGFKKHMINMRLNLK